MAREEKKQEKVEEEKIEQVSPKTQEIVETPEVTTVEPAVSEAPAAEEAKPAAQENAKPEAPKVSAPAGWRPKTELGKKVMAGEITDISKVFAEGWKISEPAIVDVLLPNLEKETILIGGSCGKGGGARRTPFKRSSRMHKSGRRFKISVMTVIGNRDGYVGVGLASGPAGKNQEVVNKSLNKAKLGLIPVRRGCGSWECGCGTNHSIPIEVEGKSGSVRLQLFPAPKGVGLATSDEIKKFMRLAGISDIWCKSRGHTQMRANLIKASFDALRRLDAFKVSGDFKKCSGMTTGKE